MCQKGKNASKMFVSRFRECGKMPPLQVWANPAACNIVVGQ